MTGKNCVGICSDSRLGNQAQTVATDFEKIFKMGEQLMVSRLEERAAAGGVRQCAFFLWGDVVTACTKAVLLALGQCANGRNRLCPMLTLHFFRFLFLNSQTIVTNNS